MGQTIVFRRLPARGTLMGGQTTKNDGLPHSRLFAFIRGSILGQSSVEFALIYAGVLMPLTFMLIFTAQLLWVWHSVVEFTRDGAQYAATHCWQAGAENVLNHMRSHVPLMIDRDQFQSGQAELVVEYLGRDPETGELVEFACEGGECSTACVPDFVTVRVQNYQFRRFMSFLGLPPVTIPDFRASAPMESAGCSAGEEAGVCLP